MSWQTYVDDHLMCDIEGQKLTSSAIIGLDSSVWAQSSSVPQFKPEELTAIVNDFNEPGSLAPTGLHIASAKYMVIQGEPGAVIRGKKVRTIISLLLIPAEPGLLAPTGLHIASTKYMVIQGEPGAVIHGKKGSGGVTVKKTNQALIFGIYDEPTTPGQCNMIIDRMGDYLIDQGL